MSTALRERAFSPRKRRISEKLDLAEHGNESLESLGHAALSVLLSDLPPEIAKVLGLRKLPGHVAEELAAALVTHFAFECPGEHYIPRSSSLEAAVRRDDARVLLQQGNPVRTVSRQIPALSEYQVRQLRDEMVDAGELDENAGQA